MPHILIIHGAYGSPKENWIPWISSKLEKLGHDVHVPSFPTPDGQSLDNWRAVFQPYEKYLHKDSIIIGHSIGPAFILDILENAKNPLKAAILISPFIRFLNNTDFDTINQSFVNRNHNWDKIKANCQHFSIFHSDNDPYVPVDCAKEVADALGVDLRIINGAGHFNTSAGYSTFNILLEDVRKLLS